MQNNKEKARRLPRKELIKLYDWLATHGDELERLNKIKDGALAKAKRRQPGYRPSTKRRKIEGRTSRSPARRQPSRRRAE